MALLNKQMVVRKWRILGISSGLTQYGQLQLGHCGILPPAPAPAGPPGGLAMEPRWDKKWLNPKIYFKKNIIYKIYENLYSHHAIFPKIYCTNAKRPGNREMGKWGNGEMGRAMRVVVDWIGSLTNG